MTDFLYAIPSATDGAMSIIDLFGLAPEYNYSKTTTDADRRAFAADVKALQVDMSNACGKVLCRAK